MAAKRTQLIKRLIKSSQIFSSLESKNYRLYFSGQSISLIGSWMQSIAMGWLVYRLTGSKFLLGFIGFTSQIPSFVLSPFAGVIIDRFNRHKIMLWTQILFMVQALLFSILVLFNLIQIWHIIALSLVFGFITAFDAPARQSLVIDLIDKPENLGNAIALNSAMFNGARLFGPAIAGVLIAIVKEGPCFLINALSYIAVIWALNKIQTPPRVQKEPKGLNDGLKEGFNYTFGFKPIKILIILLAVLSLIGMPFTTLMPAYTSEVLKGSSHTYGFLMSASGAGAFLGAVYLASRKTVIGLGKIIAYSSVMFGLSLMGVAWSANLSLSLIFIALAGFFMITAIASINTLVQTLTEEHMRGRVMSFYAMALMGMNPIGNLAAGSMASGIGISYTLLVGGITVIFAGIWFAAVRPSLRKYTQPIYIKKGFVSE
jgi:Arabinose efflux permease